MKIPNYLIGPAYALTPYCMKEFETCKRNEQVIFNVLLCAARNPIECAYGRLKARWSTLTRKVDLKLESVPIVVFACFVLHNYCERNNSYIDESQIRAQLEIGKENENKNQSNPDPFFSCDAGEGEVIRNILVDYIKDNLPGK